MTITHVITVHSFVHDVTGVTMYYATCECNGFESTPTEDKDTATFNGNQHLGRIVRMVDNENARRGHELIAALEEIAANDDGDPDADLRFDMNR